MQVGQKNRGPFTIRPRKLGRRPPMGCRSIAPQARPETGPAAFAIKVRLAQPGQQPATTGHGPASNARSAILKTGSNHPKTSSRLVGPDQGKTSGRPPLLCDGVTFERRKFGSTALWARPRTKINLGASGRARQSSFVRRPPARLHESGHHPTATSSPSKHHGGFCPERYCQVDRPFGGHLPKGSGRSPGPPEPRGQTAPVGTPPAYMSAGTVQGANGEPGPPKSRPVFEWGVMFLRTSGPAKKAADPPTNPMGTIVFNAARPPPSPPARFPKFVGTPWPAVAGITAFIGPNCLSPKKAGTTRARLKRRGAVG